MSGLSGHPLAVELAERGDIAGAVEAQMASARRNGSHPDGVERSGRLFLSMVQRVFELQAAQLQWDAGLLKLEAQYGSAGKAAANGLRMELLSEQMAQLSLDPRIRREGIHGGKAMADLTNAQERELGRFIRRIGGYVPSGGRPDDVLDFDATHFERAMALIWGEVEPDSDDERRELERWRAKYPPPGTP